jgi:hypothetical protein
LMMAARQRHAMLIGENISLDRQVAAIVASHQPNLRLWIRSRAPADVFTSIYKDFTGLRE